MNNLTSGRYKTCGYGRPNYQGEDGHYDEVYCAYFNNRAEFCGDIICPLDQQDIFDRDDYEE